jgi:hypothetical protein
LGEPASRGPRQAKLAGVEEGESSFTAKPCNLGSIWVTSSYFQAVQKLISGVDQFWYVIHGISTNEYIISTLNNAKNAQIHLVGHAMLLNSGREIFQEERAD